MDLSRLVMIYKRKNKPKLDETLRGFRELGSREVVVKMAALGIVPSGKRHAHQRRLQRTVLETAAADLLNSVADIGACGSFEELIRVVKEKTAGLKGFGELAVYDTALRIGAFRGMYPSSVYLHAGTRTGARLFGFDSKRESLAVTEFPSPLRDLPAHEIEDFLCIFKEALRNLHATQN